MNNLSALGIGLVLVLLGGGPARASEPALPTGLGGQGASEPALPSGLGTPGKPSATSGTLESGSALELSGFVETRYGRRLSDVGSYESASIAEARMQLEGAWSTDLVSVQVTADLVVDGVVSGHNTDLETGEGWIDLREASAVWRPADNIDLKLGRQVLTWGTGDLIFINDLFPKDWTSFFIGRDDEYLKAPSDALKASFYVDDLTLDLVYTPRFDADRYIDGRRLTFFDPLAGGIRQQPEAVAVMLRDDYGSDQELAFRISGQLGGIEWAGYFYDGYRKSPEGYAPVAARNIFPELSVYGASLRGPVVGGIAHAEFGYYDAQDEGAVGNPFLPNSEVRFLAGYERELVPELNMGVQYYLEHLLDHGAYLASLPIGMRPKDENRHVLTLRLTQMLMNQTLTLSLFSFWSPSDEDGYLRLKAAYKVTDDWALEAGANLLYGESEETFFGQFADNNNLFLAARFSF